MHGNASQRGFVTLASVMILLAVAVAAALIAFLAAWQSVDSQASWRSWAHAQMYADACVETARARLWQNPAYAGSESLSFPSGACEIGGIVTASSSREVSATGISATGTARTFASFALTIASGSVEDLEVMQFRRVVGF